MPRYRTTKAGRTWGRTIKGWVLLNTEGRGTWIARRDDDDDPWTLYRQGVPEQTFTARTLDEAADRIAQHDVPKPAPTPLTASAEEA